MTRLSKIISIIFHPVFALFSGILILCLVPSEPILSPINSLYDLRPELKKHLFILYGTFTVIFPVTSILALYSTRAIPDLELKNQKDRFLPVVIVLAIHSILYYFLRRAGVPPILLASLTGVIGGFALFLIINSFFKISLHGIGAGFLFGLVLSYYKIQQEFSFIPLIIIGLLIGLVGWARVHQKAHTNLQYFAGVVLGIILEIICIIFELFL